MVTTSRSRVARPLALVAAGVVVGVTARRLPDTGVGVVAVLLVLAVVFVVVVRRDRRARRAGADPEAQRPPGRHGPTQGAARRRAVRHQNLRANLWFLFGLHPAGYLGAQGWQDLVVSVLVDLGSVRLMQWSRAAGANLPFTTGEVALVADADRLAVVRAGRAGAPVHRWGWDEVELSGQESPEVSLLVLTLLGPTPAPRARGPWWWSAAASR